MAAVNQSAMALSEDKLNDMDEWLLDFLNAHEWATPNLMRQFYNDEQDSEEEKVSRQWVSGRLSRLSEHGHLDKVHPDADEYRFRSDPRELSKKQAVRKEKDIVWLRPPEEMEYVRARVKPTMSKTGPYPDDRIYGEIVGYAELEDEVESLNSGGYNRRIFFLKEHDRPAGGDKFQRSVPAEAVDPLTVEPKRDGEVTDRALNRED